MVVGHELLDVSGMSDYTRKFRIMISVDSGAFKV